MIDDLYMNDKAPKDRDIAMVFQNYALYAHMTVYHNMAFSLVLRKADSNFIHERVMWAAEVLGLTPYLNRKPANLSGGQRQRVAVGRAMVRDPKIFLFDEPLSNLDAKLRGVMRKELKQLHNQLKTTMIYVTHDQIEALTLADRIVIMKSGFIQQVGTPTEVYDDPINLFVAKFIGLPAMNIVDAVITEEGEVVLQKLETGKNGEEIIIENQIPIKNKAMRLALEEYIGKTVKLGVRPEHIQIEKKGQTTKGIEGITINNELLGAESLIHFSLSENKLIAKTKVRDDIKIGDAISFTFMEEDVYFFDAETEERIYAKE